MKKMLLSTVIALSLFACKSETKETTNAANPDQDGITISKSANIDIVKEINEDLVAFDFVKLRSHYTDSTKVHDNLNIQQIDTNLAMFTPMKNAGLKFSIEGKPLVFEIVNAKADEKGITNFVDTYYTLGVNKGGVKKLCILNQVFAMKDGKVMEEWDTYDTAPNMEMMTKK
jgi:hypothetical protein